MGDFFVDAHDGVRLAARDHGGDGPGMVLLHGAGSHLLSMGYLARQLDDFHVVTMDGRWSGLSGDAPLYDWDDLVRDVGTIATEVGLDNPIVVGHSWGGMIAAHYGAAHPDAPAAVNLDGHGGPTHESHLEGMTTAEARDALEILDALRASVEVATSGDEAWYWMQREVVYNAARAGGLREDRAVEFADRSFVQNDGMWRSRPAATLFDGLKGDLGLFAVYRRVECPLLILDTPAGDGGLPPELQGLMDSYRRSLTETLDAIAADRPNIRVAHLPHVDHQGIAGRHGREVAQTIRAFLADFGVGIARR